MKILFVGISLKAGGVERALVDQVNNLVERGYEVDLFLFSHIGPYLEDINNKVKILQEDNLLHYAGMTMGQSKKDVKSYVIRNAFGLIVKIIGSKRFYKILFSRIKKMGKYDVGISYFHDGSLKSLYYGPNQFVLTKVIANKKIAWIHSDYKFAGMNVPERNLQYQMFDGVVNVSMAMKKQFEALGVLNDNSKSYMVYNRIDTVRIINKSLQYKPQVPEGLIKFVTVGRLEESKGTRLLLGIANKLKLSGCRFAWYFIGTGVLHDYANNYIREKELSDNVYLLGQLDNPYPYLSQSDVFVSGSLSETFGISILEAVVLKLWVVALKYDAIGEIIDEKVGDICDSSDDLYVSLKRILDDKMYLKRKKELFYTIKDYNSLNEKQFDKLVHN